MTIAEKDKMLISLLQEDGRLSFTTLGRKLGLTHTGTRKRFSTLIKQGYAKVQAWLSVEKLKLRAMLIFAEVKDDKSLRKLSEVFEVCPRIIFLASLFGGLNLVAMMIAENEDVLESEATICSIRRMKGIKRTEIQVVGEIYYPKYVPLRIIPKKQLNVTPCQRECESCLRYQSGKCVGCPATKAYKGPL